MFFILDCVFSWFVDVIVTPVLALLHEYPKLFLPQISDLTCSSPGQPALNTDAQAIYVVKRTSEIHIPLPQISVKLHSVWNAILDVLIASKRASSPRWRFKFGAFVFVFTYSRTWQRSPASIQNWRFIHIRPDLAIESYSLLSISFIGTLAHSESRMSSAGAILFT
jgi:hypothetical protein